MREAVGPSGSATTGSPPFTPRAKKVLELSLGEALQLGHTYIGTEHLLLGVIREGEGVAAQVLISLSGDLARVRQQVIQLLSGYPSTEVVEAAGASFAAERDGPRCPSCRSLLDGQVGYRVLPVAAAGEVGGSRPIDVLFVYCLGCGVMLAHTPANELGLGAAGGSEVVG